MAEPTTLLDAMIAEMLGDVRRLNDDVAKLEAVLPAQIRAIEQALPASLAASEQRLADLAEQIASADNGYRASIIKLAEQQRGLLGSQAESWFRDGKAEAEQRIRKEVQDGLRELRSAIVGTVLAEIVRPVKREVEDIRHGAWKIMAGFLLCNVLSLCAVLYGLWHFGMLPPGPGKSPATPAGPPVYAPAPRQVR